MGSKPTYTPIGPEARRAASASRSVVSCTRPRASRSARRSMRRHVPTTPRVTAWTFAPVAATRQCSPPSGRRPGRAVSWGHRCTCACSRPWPPTTGAAASPSLLDGRSRPPVHDAIVLRLLGAAHRLALAGEAPGFAACSPVVRRRHRARSGGAVPRRAARAPRRRRARPRAHGPDERGGTGRRARRGVPRGGAS